MAPRKPPEIDAERLRVWLDAELGSCELLQVKALRGGGSCEVFDVRRGGEHWVLRRAPSKASAQTAHDVLREFRILDAVKDTDVRIARPVIACDDVAVAGAPFYLMDFVDGVPIREKLPEAYSDSAADQVLALSESVDALTELHTVDWQACGLDGLGKPEGYLERQVPRWLDQLEGYRCRDLDAADEVAKWLRDHLPAAQPPSLVHGDYKLDNLLYSQEVPARVIAVVDWEMASIGDPLVDLAWWEIFFPEPGNALALGAAGQPGGFMVDALPSRETMIGRYAAATGRDVSQLDWYRVFSPWKLAIVLEGSYAKHVRGESKNPLHPFFGQMVDTLLERSVACARGE